MIYNSKVVFGNEVIMDITDTTADEQSVLTGKKFYKADGSPANGSCDYDANTSDATAVAGDIVAGSIAYVNGNKITGTMPNIGGESEEIDTVEETATISLGYHDGSGRVGISSVEKAKIIASNIKSGVTILGVTGTYSGESVTAQTKNVTPTVASQTVLPDAGYDYLSQVNVAAIPYTSVLNAQGGYTVTIAGV